MTMTTSIVAELHDGPAHRHRQDGSMWYIPPRTGQRLISVTSVFDFIAKEQLDKRWRPGLSAQAAFDELPGWSRPAASNRVAAPTTNATTTFRIGARPAPAATARRA